MYFLTCVSPRSGSWQGSSYEATPHGGRGGKGKGKGKGEGKGKGKSGSEYASVERIHILIELLFHCVPFIG